MAKPQPANGYAYGLEEFVNLFAKPVEWIWEGLLPTEALVVFSAWVKMGKSTLTYGLLSAMAKGEPFLGLRTNPTKTLIVIPEEGTREVANRLVKFGLHKAPGMVEIRRMHHATSGDYAALTYYIQQNGIGLVVIDTLAAFTQMIDENDNAEMVRVMQPLLDLAHDYGVTVLAIHHTGKGGSKDVARASRGASALSGVVDVGWMLTRIGQRRSNRRWLETISRIPEVVDGIEYAWDKPSGVFTTGAEMPELVPEAGEATLGNDIESLLALGKEPLTMSEIAIRLGKTVKRIQQEMTPLPPWCIRTGDGVRGKPYLYDHRQRVGTLTDESQEARVGS